MGDLIVAGYRLGTTTFMHLGMGHPDNPDPNVAAVDNRRLWYLGPVSTEDGPTIAQPSYRGYQSLGGTPVFPATYSVAALRPWHSGEDDPAVGNEPIRPWYSIRNAMMPPRATPPPTVPPSMTSLTWQQLGQAYLATLGDATPHLIPDWHPWWSNMAVVLPWLARPYYEVPPSFTIWQNCPQNPLTPQIYNLNLYQHGWYNRVNPPGTFDGFTDPGTGRVFRWLDGTDRTGIDNPQTFFALNNWQAPPPTMIVTFDQWCRGGQEATRTFLFPSTRAANAELSALRFSVEWPDSGLPWQHSGTEIVKNIQTFLVLVDG